MWSTMSRMWSYYSAGSSGMTRAPAASRWSLPHLLPLRFSALLMRRACQLF
jgi:hypothetical protein